MKINKVIGVWLMLLTMVSCGTDSMELSLAGEWQVALDSMDVGVEQEWYGRSFSDRIMLPGTLDEAGYGTLDTSLPSVEKPQILHLTRKHSYVGPAWYVREVDIPASWSGRRVILQLERVLWQTRVWVDGKAVAGKQESLSAPHRFELTGYLTAGRHTIALRVDNRKQYDISTGDMAHAYTNETQVMWNGVLGKMALSVAGPVDVDSLRAYPDLKARAVRLTAVVKNDAVLQDAAWQIEINDCDGRVTELEGKVRLNEGTNGIDICCPLGDSVRTWDEFSPHLYTLTLRMKAGDDQITRQLRFGMRELDRDDNRILINGHRAFLRGTLECCIFPLTGHPPMDMQGWEKVFSTAREWGLNHLRFHSWCPPEAAFQVADSLGFYLQVELPLWPDRVGEDAGKDTFLYQEADRILAEYGNHPSFCFLSLGNELPDDFTFLAALLQHVKRRDCRHLYTTTSFSFERGHGGWPEPDDDYWVTQWTKYGWVRGQGVFEAQEPAFDADYATSLQGLEVPVVSHEVGQYAVYPNLREIDKYTGTLAPLNLLGVKAELERKGLADRADDYLKASGRLAYILYKEEVERALKTDGFSGFQLLDLHDFPGQGTALVGLLDAFWDSKGVAKPEEFRQFCAPVVPLAYFPKAVYTQDEVFEARIGIANYSASSLVGQRVQWTMETRNGDRVAAGEFAGEELPVGLSDSVGTVRAALSGIHEAQELVLTVALEGSTYRNSWKLWVYPSDLPIDSSDVLVTADWEEACQALDAGKDVLLNPPYTTCSGLEGKFVPVFWSPVHFPNQAGTMGILLDPHHCAFTYFPTSFHTDWQWWYLTKHAKTLCVDGLNASVTPLVECVDNFVNNRRLCLLFETRCGNGRLLFSSMDLIDSTTPRPEKRQLLYSLLRYMQSDDFAPVTTATWEQIYQAVHLK